jgi:AraC family transcriptional regulator, transcriptional activator of pobA
MIPIHDFKKSSQETMSFRFIPLNQRSDYDFTKAHRHSYYEIFLFSKGGGYHEIDFNAHNITDASIHFVTPGQVHKVRRAPDSFGAILLFSDDFYHLGAKADLPLHDYPFLNTHSEGSPIVQLQEEQFNELLSISQIMGKEKANSDPVGLEVIRTYLHIFLLKCHQYHSHQKTHRQPEGLALFHRFKALLEKAYNKEHLSSYYSGELLVSNKKLNEVCKTFAGTTPNNIIKNRLVLEAKRRLLHSDNNVKEIGYQLGFEDPAYFNRFFRKHVEMSAISFKKRFINDASL